LRYSLLVHLDVLRDAEHDYLIVKSWVKYFWDLCSLKKTTIEETYWRYPKKSMSTTWIYEIILKSSIFLCFLWSFCFNYHFRMLFLVIPLLDDSFNCLLGCFMTIPSICSEERMIILETGTNESSCSCIYMLTEIDQWLSDQKSVWIRKIVCHILFHN
jgi:hypothetical protein